jgi:RNase H-like domain found in reverse transcriptase
MAGPTNDKELISFLGHCNYYRRFVQECSAVASPLTNLQRQERSFEWTPRVEESFQGLKCRLVNATTLCAPGSKEFVVTTDASDFAVGTVLSQDQGHGLRSVAYESCKMNPVERNYVTDEEELLTAVHALKTWRIYLEGHQQACWSELPLGYDFNIR